MRMLNSNSPVVSSDSAIRHATETHSMTAAFTPKTVSCPTCGKPVEWSGSQRWKPFCSERCKLIDLGAWLDESHRIPGNETENPDEDIRD